jgi:6-phosphofructokinase 1
MTIHATYKQKTPMPTWKKIPAYYAFRAAHEMHHLASWFKNLLIKPAVSGKNKSVLIVVGGGPAPGIPNAVRSATLTALRNGFKVYGAIKSFGGAADGTIVELTYKDVWNLKHSKTNLIQTARFKMTEKALTAIIKNILSRNIVGVVTIGGDDTATTGKKLQERGIPVFSLTKTVDDDVLSAEFIDHTFGWDTATSLAGNIISNFVNDAYTENRWFVVRMMGRGSGSLALESAVRGGAHACIIPEEFAKGECTLAAIKERVRKTIEERKALGMNYGVIVLAEGLEEAIKEEIGRLLEAKGLNVPRDVQNNISLNDLPPGFQIHEIVVDDLPGNRAKVIHGKKVNLEAIGYDFRTANPSRQDIRITSREGRAAIQFLMAGKPSSMVSYKYDNALGVPYETPGVFAWDDEKQENRLVTRQVDVESESYKNNRDKLRLNFLSPLPANSEVDPAWLVKVEAAKAAVERERTDRKA